MSEGARSERWRRAWWLAPLAAVTVAGVAAAVVLAPDLGQSVPVPRQLVISQPTAEPGNVISSSPAAPHRHRHHPTASPALIVPSGSPERVVTPSRMVITTSPEPKQDRSGEPRDDSSGTARSGDH